ncbi:MAG: tRNA preQ1(34) S-adenosylmethionine ribosyltransferase-isomerase QueA [Planctomycetota bacterium]
MRTDDFDFDLPADRIATAAAEPRDAARLMIAHRDTGKIEHAHVRDLPQWGVLQPGDLMAVNQTRVLPAYLTGIRTQTGGKITGLFVQSCDDPGSQGSQEHWEVMLESGGKLKPGDTVDLHTATGVGASVQLELRDKLSGGAWRVRVRADGPTDPPTLLGRVGQTPLPPYIRKARKARQQIEVSGGDFARYNTVFAEPAAAAASVAAPTAGLHFTPELLTAIDAMGVRRVPVTLHVGLGTFLPVKTETIEDHPIHSEWIHVPADTLDAIRRMRDHGRELLAVGTTTVRCLESLPASLDGLDGYTDNTRLFITPDRVAAGEFAYRFTDHLLTNFHLPRSTLLAMVAALPGVGLPRLLDWYRQAIDAGYRFYSFGDAMLIV